MSDRDDEEAVAGVGNTGQGVVPGNEGREEAEETARLDKVGVWMALGVVEEISDTEHEEGDLEEEEQQEEGHCGPESAEEDDGVEDEPALIGLTWIHRNKRKKRLTIR